jgi:PAS domain S-box-containing protein
MRGAPWIAVRRRLSKKPWAVWLPASAVVLLGLIVLAGWAIRSPAMIRVMPGAMAMVFNTALQFGLLGVALLVPTGSRRGKRVVQALASFVIALSGVVLAQYLFSFDAGVDQLVVRPWILDNNPSPGRMAPNTCLCFMSAGCLLLLLQRTPTRRTAVVLPLLTFTIFTLGGIGLAGYLLRLDYLYGWFNYTRMAVHTALGNLALGAAFWASWQREAWFANLYAGREDRKVALTAAGILVAVALTAGVTGFGTMLHATAETLTGGLESALDHRIDLVRHDVEAERAKAKMMAGDATIVQALRERSNESARAATNVLHGAAHDHYRHLLLVDRQGRTVAEAGAAATPEMTVALPNRAGKLTYAGEMLIQVESEVFDGGVKIGTLGALARLPQLDALLLDPDSIGESSRLNLCIDAGEKLRCFPSRHAANVTERPKRAQGGDVPMALATRGKTGVTPSTFDTRGVHVLAAYRWVPDLGLGAVLKMDTMELYRPVRQKVMLVWPLLLFLVVLGTWLIRTQVEPLVRTILIAERNASSVSEALAESERKSRAVVDTVSDGILSLDHEGYIEAINPAARRILGLTPRNAQGRRLFQVLGLAAQTPAMERALRLASAGRSGETAQTVEIAYDRNGSATNLEVVLSGAIGPASSGLVAAVRDISERRRVERMKEEFVATVSHELRTPLTSIRGSLGLVTSGVLGPVPENARRLLDIALGNSERLMRLINDLLDIDKMAAGRLEFDKQLIDLKPLVQRAVETTRGFGAARRVRIELAEAAAHASVRVDADRIEQALVNLLSNAIKYSPDDEVVEVAIEIEHPVVRVSVQDHGSGVPEDFRDRIFSKFSQADASDARVKGGTGLGLSITKAIVEGHDGRVDYESPPGRGARFYFELPLEDGPKPLSMPATEFTGSPYLFRQARILHVENDLQTREVIAALLEPIAEIVGVSNLERARAAMQKTQFDLVLLDLELSGEDGTDLIDELTRDALHVPIIVFTAHDERIDSELVARVESVLVKTRVSDETFKREVERVIVSGGSAEAKRYVG